MSTASTAAGGPSRTRPGPPHQPLGQGDGTTGWVALVGGGPGAEDLITVRGHRLLAQADVVITDALAPTALLRDLPGRDGQAATVIDASKRRGSHTMDQRDIDALLVEHALQGRRVVRLKGGDPYVLGRGGEEVAACRRAGVPVEVVPGVTSAVAVPAAAGIPVTHRGVSRGFTVVTAHADLGEVPSRRDHTLILLMGVTRLRASVETLLGTGHDPATAAAVIERAYTPSQRVTTTTLRHLPEVAARVGVSAPAVIVVGDVVTLSPAWADRVTQ